MVDAVFNSNSESGVIFIVNANDGTLQLEAATPGPSLHLILGLGRGNEGGEMGGRDGRRENGGHGKEVKYYTAHIRNDSMSILDTLSIHHLL